MFDIVVGNRQPALRMSIITPPNHDRVARIRIAPCKAECSVTISHFQTFTLVCTCPTSFAVWSRAPMHSSISCTQPDLTFRNGRHLNNSGRVATEPAYLRSCEDHKRPHSPRDFVCIRKTGLGRGATAIVPGRQRMRTGQGPAGFARLRLGLDGRAEGAGIDG